MSLVIARCANKIGMPKTAEKIVKSLYGEPFGKISKAKPKLWKDLFPESLIERQE